MRGGREYLSDVSSWLLCEDAAFTKKSDVVCCDCKLAQVAWPDLGGDALRVKLSADPGFRKEFMTAVQVVQGLKKANFIKQSFESVHDLEMLVERRFELVPESLVEDRLGTKSKDFKEAGVEVCSFWAQKVHLFSSLLVRTIAHFSGPLLVYHRLFYNA